MILQMWPTGVVVSALARPEWLVEIDDWSDASPLADLQLLWKRYQPQMNDYVNRARDPEQAPSFGVPGDL